MNLGPKPYSNRLLKASVVVEMNFTLDALANPTEIIDQVGKPRQAGGTLLCATSPGSTHATPRYHLV